MSNSQDTEILCIGSVLWDVIGYGAVPMQVGHDVPGRITRRPGGVALNIACGLVAQGMRPVLLSAVGQDRAGRSLIAECEGLGLDVSHVIRQPNHPTDTYMAVEAENGLIAAVADAHSLEAAGDEILAPLRGGALGSAQSPYGGVVVLDGNLTAELLGDIARDPAFGAADLRVAPASPGKALRLLPFLDHPRAVLYVNLEEAGLLCRHTFSDAASAARALVERGARRALVTDGARAACDDDGTTQVIAAPPRVEMAQVTGAGDTFIAAHIAAEICGGEGRENAFAAALLAAATHVSGGS